MKTRHQCRRAGPRSLLNAVVTFTASSIFNWLDQRCSDRILYVTMRKIPGLFRVLRVTHAFMLPQHRVVKPKKNATLNESEDEQPQPRLSALT